MGIFNPNAPLHADLNLMVQVIIFILLAGGVTVAKFKRDFNKHGTVMGIALILNSLSIAVVMIPSLLSFKGLLSPPFSRPALIVILHSVAGILVEIWGIWLVVIWAVRRRIKDCAGRKNSMRATVLFWLLELLLGIYVYVMLYLPI